MNAIFQLALLLLACSIVSSLICDKVPAVGYPIAITLEMHADDFSACANKDLTTLDRAFDRVLNHMRQQHTASLGDTELDLIVCTHHDNRNLRGPGRHLQWQGYTWYVSGGCASCGGDNSDRRRLAEVDNSTVVSTSLSETVEIELADMLSILLTESIQSVAKCLDGQHPTVNATVLNAASFSSDGCDRV